MRNRIIPPSELIVNSDGSIFHLHLTPGQLADTVILVGDPGRVEQVAGHFETREMKVQNREFVTVTGSYKGRRMSVLSTGIGTDNIDIVVTELDALANIDLKTRTINERHKRWGAPGACPPALPIGTFLFSRTSVGFDGLLNFYAGRDEVCDLEIEQAFMRHVGWGGQLPKPYFVDADESLFKLFQDATTEGITISAPGFYAPQGRYVRLQPADPQLNDKIASFDYNGRRITNFEMEGSALAGLSRLMGHRAATLCTIIAQRAAGDMQTDYRPFVDRMIAMALDKLVES